MAVDGISGKYGPSPIDAEQTRSKSSNNSKTPTDPEAQDRVSISEGQEEFARIRRLVDLVPDVRKDRVDRIAQAVERGTYDVSDVEIADAVIEGNWIDFMA